MKTKRKVFSKRLLCIILSLAFMFSGTALYGQANPAAKTAAEMVFSLYKFDGEELGDLPIQSGVKAVSGELRFYTPGAPGWYAVVEDDGAIDPLYVFVDENGAILSTVKDEHLDPKYSVSHWSSDLTTYMRLICSDGHIYEEHTKPDGSGQLLQTEKFVTTMPDGRQYISFCADLGAHYVNGVYEFDLDNHGFSDEDVHYLVAAFDYINDTYTLHETSFSPRTCGLETKIGKAIAQFVLWNLILEKEGAGFATQWFADREIVRIEGHRDWWTAEYNNLLNDIMENRKKYTDIYNAKVSAGLGKNDVAGAVFSKGTGFYSDGRPIAAIDQQRQMIVLFGGDITLGAALDVKFIPPPSTGSVVIEKIEPNSDGNPLPNFFVHTDIRTGTSVTAGNKGPASDPFTNDQGYYTAYNHFVYMVADVAKVRHMPEGIDCDLVYGNDQAYTSGTANIKIESRPDGDYIVFTLNNYSGSAGWGVSGYFKRPDGKTNLHSGQAPPPDLLPTETASGGKYMQTRTNSSAALKLPDTFPAHYDGNVYLYFHTSSLTLSDTTILLNETIASTWFTFQVKDSKGPVTLTNNNILFRITDDTGKDFNAGGAIVGDGTQGMFTLVNGARAVLSGLKDGEIYYVEELGAGAEYNTYVSVDGAAHRLVPNGARIGEVRAAGGKTIPLHFENRKDRSTVDMTVRKELREADGKISKDDTTEFTFQITKRNPATTLDTPGLPVNLTNSNSAYDSIIFSPADGGMFVDAANGIFTLKNGATFTIKGNKTTCYIDYVITELTDIYQTTILLNGLTTRKYPNSTAPADYGSIPKRDTYQHLRNQDLIDNDKRRVIIFERACTSQSIIFINQKEAETVEYGTLELTKIVEGAPNGELENISFAFEVGFIGKGIDAVSSAWTNEDNVNIWRGTLKHGESVLFTDIPLGSVYTVYELPMANWVIEDSKSGVLEDSVGITVVNRYVEPEPRHRHHRPNRPPSRLLSRRQATT
jgi:hypothetical protein